MSWCRANRVSALKCTAPNMLQYLQELLEAGKSPSTIRGMVVAIKAARVGNRLAEGDCSLISQFLRGTQRLAPRSRTLAVPAWDLGLVLRALRVEPFEPLELIDLKWLSLKVAFLLAVTSARRVGELQALSTHEDCYRFLLDDAGVILRPTSAFLPKVPSEFNRNQPVELRSFCPTQENGEEGQEGSWLCPVRALRVYIQRTQALRKTDQLFVCFKLQCLGQPVSKSRLSHWIVEMIQQAYKGTGVAVPGGLRAHSTRSMATSWASWAGCQPR